MVNDFNRFLMGSWWAKMESLFCGHAGCGHAGCGHAGCGHAGHRLPAIVYVKPKICDQCYFSYYPPSPLPPTPIKKERKNNVQLLIPCAL